MTQLPRMLFTYTHYIVYIVYTVSGVYFAYVVCVHVYYILYIYVYTQVHRGVFFKQRDEHEEVDLVFWTYQSLANW